MINKIFNFYHTHTYICRYYVQGAWWYGTLPVTWYPASCGHFAENGTRRRQALIFDSPVILLRHLENSNGFALANKFHYYQNLILKNNFLKKPVSEPCNRYDWEVFPPITILSFKTPYSRNLLVYMHFYFGIRPRLTAPELRRFSRPDTCWAFNLRIFVPYGLNNSQIPPDYED